MKSILKQIEVMQAYHRGETIRGEEVNGPLKFITKNDGVCGLAYFNWRDYDYDILRKPIEGWVWACEDGHVSNYLYLTEAHARKHEVLDGRPVLMRQVI